jgi:putative ABC transport system permease protein
MLRTAIRFLLHDKAKSFGALFGVIMSIFLIGQQSGIFIFLTNAMAALVRNNDQYVWVVDNITTNVNALAPLDVRIGRQLESLPGIAAVHPFVVAGASARFPDGTTAGMSVIGTEAPHFSGGPWKMAKGTAQDLLPDGAVTTDIFDRNALAQATVGTSFELNGKRVHVAAQTYGARSFGGGILAFTTLERARYLGNVDRNKAQAFLVEAAPGVPMEQVVATINATVPGVRAWMPMELRKATVITVLKSSGIAISFGTLIVFALIVGFVIIGLTLYSATIDRIRDYGTLKAIGATDRQVRRLVLTQSLLISALGFVLAMVFVEGFRNGIAKAGTLFDYPLWLRFGFLLITLFLALVGSLFALRRITKLEPAAVFRG